MIVSAASKTALPNIVNGKKTFERGEQPSKGVKRKLKLIPKDEENEETIKRLEEAAKKGFIKNTVWVSPGLPMLIFITTGLITALLLGDLVWALISFLLS